MGLRACTAVLCYSPTVRHTVRELVPSACINTVHQGPRLRFHAKFRADEWLLYEMESPRAGGGRGLAFGRIFTQDGTLAVTVAQEGVMRLSADFELKLPPLRSKL